MIKNILLIFTFFLYINGNTQTSEIRGFIFDKEAGTNISSVSIYIESIKRGTFTDNDGYYSLAGLKSGKYVILINAIGYDSMYVNIELENNTINKRNFYLLPKGKVLNSIKILGQHRQKIQRKKEEQINIGVTTIDARTLERIPTVGGEPDLVQYLQVLPGVVFSGDQGGQLYIRGGSPVMNKVLLDGMTIYNPFHSIGLFSVFDADVIQSADVYSAGFGAEYGGRISAIVDVKTRDGKKTKSGGKFSTNPFTSKLLIEGPIRKFKEGEGSSSYLISARTSYLEKSSKIFYPYANPERLPYNFNDIYGKLSFNSPSGGKTNLFGFNFADNVNFPNSTKYAWNSYGFGGKFLIVPEGTKSKIDANFSYSKYDMQQNELDLKPRRSSIEGFNVNLIFTSVFKNSDFKYGIETNGFKTNFEIYNSNNRKIKQEENTTEINLFSNYHFYTPKYVLECGLRYQYYASLANGSLEPRMALKHKINKRFRFKSAVGKYSQNLLSAVSDRDIVNLFYGFLSAPDNLQKDFDGKKVKQAIQKAYHAVAGFEWDLSKNSEINVEAFYKDFNQLTNINRDKIFDNTADNQDKPELQRLDYIIESGKAYGGDFRYKYEDKKYYIWLVYSLTYVTRFDGRITYAPNFDRRHNINIVTSMTLDKKGNHEVNARWNFGSGFPFTQTQSFYEKLDFQGGIGTNYTQSNGTLGIMYGDVNKGRLPYYHRLDVSYKYKTKINKTIKAEFLASIINTYDRANIFYFDRVRFQRVNQLPFMPSVGMNFSW